MTLALLGTFDYNAYLEFARGSSRELREEPAARPRGPRDLARPLPLSAFFLKRPLKAFQGRIKGL